MVIKMKKIINKIYISLLVLIISLSFIGCSKVAEISIDIKNWDGLINYSESSKKIEYTFFILDGDLYNINNDIYKAIEEKFNVKIKIIGGGSADWKTALANKINANEIPDLFFSLPDTGTYANYIDTQVLMPLNTLVEQAGASNLQTIFNAEPYKTTASISGLNFFAPLMQEATGHAIYVNKEWMSKWNNSRGQNVDTKPVTLNEFTDMLKYFHDDGSLSFQTNYGLALSNNWDFIKSLMSTFGASIDWTVDDSGNFTLSALTEQYKALLEWMKAGVEYGYIYPGFDTDTDGDSIQKLIKKVCGACINNGDLKIEEIADEWDTTGSTPINDLLVCIAPPTNGENQGRFWGTPGYWGGMSIGINAEEPMRLIRILDYMYSEEGSKLMVYGVKGDDFDEDTNGNPVIDERHYANRTNSDAFFTPKIRGDYGTKPIGVHKFNFVTTMPFAFVDGKVEFKFNSVNYWNKEFAEEVYNYSKNNKLMANPTFLLDNMQWSDYNSKILDAVERFSLQVINGTKTYEKALNDLNNTIDNYKYSELQTYLRTKYDEIQAK
jgi:ABC-type glycerol-3-phosphate transport system substrate-binding protein